MPFSGTLEQRKGRHQFGMMSYFSFCSLSSGEVRRYVLPCVPRLIISSSSIAAFFGRFSMPQCFVPINRGRLSPRCSVVRLFHSKFRGDLFPIETECAAPWQTAVHLLQAHAVLFGWSVRRDGKAGRFPDKLWLEVFVDSVYSARIACARRKDRRHW